MLLRNTNQILFKMKKPTIFLVLLLSLMFNNQVEAQEGLIGEVRLFAGNFPPRSWAFCEGQLLAISQNQALFSIIGCAYGGDCRTTFALPDLRGRVPISPGQGPGLSNYVLAQRGGAETVVLNTTQIPSHNHAIFADGEVGRGGSTTSPTNNYLAESDAYSTEQDTQMRPTGNTGGNLAHENRPPFLAMHYIICLQGIFPSRS